MKRGVVSDCALVATFTWNGEVEFAATLTVDGVTLQVLAAGAPVHCC
jgi:hypothetical protein